MHVDVGWCMMYDTWLRYDLWYIIYVDVWYDVWCMIYDT